MHFLLNASNIKGSNDELMKNAFKRAKLKKQLIVESDSPVRVELLNEFLALKIYENIEKIYMITLPQIRVAFQESILLLDDLNHFRKDNLLVKLGSTECSLENVALESVNRSSTICPWHWEIHQRQDRYPFKIPVAKCNCESCQAKTIYDSDGYRLSACRHEISFQPVLYRTHHVNKTEKWSFAFEAVPIACVCSIKLSPQ